MIRDRILNSKRHELGNVVASRKRKLQELYHATVAFAGPVPAGHDLAQSPSKSFSEADFLDANNLLRGCYFDVNTLLRIHREPNDPVQPPAAPSIVDPNSTAATPEKEDVLYQENPSKARPGRFSSPRASPRASPARAEPSSQAVLPSTVGQASLKIPKGVEDAGTGVVEGKPGHSTLRGDGSTIQGDMPGGRQRTQSPSDKDRMQPKQSVDQRTPGRKSGPEEVAMLHGTTPSITEPQTSRHSQERDTDMAEEDEVSQPAEDASKFPASQVLSDPSAQLQFEAANSAPVPVKSPAIHRAPTTERSSNKADRVLAGPEPSASSLRGDFNVRQGSHPESSIVMRRSPSIRQPSDRRSPMRIDTDISRPNSLFAIQSTPDASTPLKSAQAASQASPPQRMTTRKSSGALRHKSVSEILGEQPKIATGDEKASPDRAASDSRETGTQTPHSAQVTASPDSAAFRSRFNELKEKEKDRSKLSTVVFPRQQLAGGLPASASKIENMHRREKALEPKDYLVTLFATQANAQTPTLHHLMATSSKILSTDNHYLEYRETQDTRMLKRIYHLQNSNRWSLRQMERSKEPERPLSHWDMLLGEAKWLQADFREERKWKVALAKTLATRCAEWVNGSADQRAALQISVQKVPRPSNEDSHITPVSLPNATGSSHSETTPELIPSMADDVSDEEEAPTLDISRSIAPSALFSLTPEDVVFGLHPTPSADKLLEELPLYQPYKDPQGKKRPYSAILDSEWQKPLVPVSKYATCKMVMKEEGPVRKRSRYDYEQEDEIGHDASGRTLLPLSHGKSSSAPEKNDVALFNPDNKHIISRLHAAHAFRPPSEFNMPSQSFFESRTPSQWTVAEDDQLRRLVREYEYNWSLIAACCSPPSLFSSAAERRTPWECFERWVSFEGLPGDMAKHQYFRAWNARRDGAREHLEQLFQAQQQNNNNTAQTPTRRRTAEPVTVTQRRQIKHVTLVHSMAKLAKKKEAAQQKQQHVASLAAMRKATEPTQPRQRMQTPREFSAHKHKQEVDYREKQMMYRQQLVATQRAALAQKAAQQVGQPPGSVVPQAGRTGLPTQPNSTANNHLSSLPPNLMPPGSRSISHQAMAAGAIPNGTQGPGGQLGLRGAGNVPQASMQAYIQAQQRLPAQTSQERIVFEAARLQEQQRMMQQQRQQQSQGNGLNGLPSAPFNGNMNIPLPHTGAMLASLQAANGKLSPAANGNPSQSHSASPGIGQNMQSQQTPSVVNPVLNQISSQLRQRHPTATPEQIKQMATSQLSQSLRNYQHANSNSVSMNGGLQLSPQQQMAFNASANAGLTSTQMYAQYMRSQQASQQANRNGLPSGSGGGGGSSSPLNGDANGMRPGSQGSVGNMQGRSGSIPNGASQSPRPPQAQMAGLSQ